MLPQTVARTPSEQERARWMTRIAERRDTAAFSALYDFYAPRLKHYLCGLGAVEAEAEELLQACLLQVWQKARLYRPEAGGVSTWIFRVARNRYFDLLRKQRLRDRPPPPEWEDPPVTTDEPPVDHQAVRQALSALPSRQAQVLYMSYYQGKSHSEIAEELGIPLGSVKSSLRLAFDKLRVSLGGVL